MFTLEELNVSPYPWRAVGDGMGGMDIRCSGCDEKSPYYEGENIIASVNREEDGLLMAKTPILYDLLYRVIKWRNDVKNGNPHETWIGIIQEIEKVLGEM